ncbi:hypothetical protein [Lysinibacillus sp. NPDC047702]|uniref:hypothetical protein n=1 Tax=unclassified Lysinibacillus TaxID=2636778 RepID=UPI003D07727E
MNKQDRLEAINKLIEFISERGRQFFFREKNRVTGNPQTAYIKFKNERVYFVDAYTNEEVYAYSGFSHKGFSHGGTLWALVCDFSHFIRTGKSSNGKHGYGGLYSGDWGHSDEIQQEIINYAKEIGYLKG